MKRMGLRALTVGGALAISGCAHPIPEAANLPPGTPYVSWIIMHGDRDNPDAEFACQSTGPRECSIPASRTDSRVFSDVHLYFHGAEPSTKYSGTFRVEFFDTGGAAPRDSTVNLTVPGDEKIANHAVTGIVTNTPGRYRLVLTLAAARGPGKETVPINQEIPVDVR